MKAEDFDVFNLISYLQGTCTNTVSSALDELYPGMTEDDLSKEDLTIIDDSIFVCDECGWFCETCERNNTNGNGDLCDDCYESYEPEEGEE